MSISRAQAKANGLKGGRPKGSKSAHTLEAVAGKAYLIKRYLENIEPIMNALIKKAKQGDLGAIRELNDRVWGKSPQPNDTVVDVRGNLQISFDPVFKK